MRITLEDLAPLKKICSRICLNIPESYRWKWDQKRNMAVVILDEEDAEMVFYPLFKEFQHHWNFSSTNGTQKAVTEYVNSEFGLMPGQAFFTSRMVCNLVMGVAWWPWGNDDKVSMRVCLIPVDKKVGDDFVFQCLSNWLNINS